MSREKRSVRAWVVIVALVAGLVVPGPGAAAAPGELTQLSDELGCVNATGAEGCAVGVAVEGPTGVAVSPDDQNVYVASSTSAAVAVFDRAPSGALTQKSGLDGCISHTGSEGQCQVGRALEDAFGVTVSPDGKSVYVISRPLTSEVVAAVAVFDRAPDGTLTQKPGSAGCISGDGSGGQCVDSPAFPASPRSIAVSPDGASVYIAGTLGGMVAVFDRVTSGPTTGELAQKALPAGCIRDAGAPCQASTGLAGAQGLVVSPDGLSVYVRSAGEGNAAVVIFDRAPTGELTQKPGLLGCFSRSGHSGACPTESRLTIVEPAIAVSPDGRQVYTVGDDPGSDDRLVAFDRITQGGALGELVVNDSLLPGSGRGLTTTTPRMALSPDGRSLLAAAIGGMAVLARDENTGVLSQDPGPGGCVNGTGAEGCATARGFSPAALGLAISSDGATAYTAGSGGVAVFDREIPVECGDVVTGLVVLRRNLDCPGHGLIVGALGTVVDLNGFVLRGQGGGHGVVMAPGVPASQVTVRGGTIRGFINGVLLAGDGRVNLDDLLLRGNEARGASLDVGRAVVRKVRAQGNGGDGMLVRTSDGRTEVVRSLFRNNAGVGIRVVANRATLKNSVARGNDGHGMLVSSSVRSVITDNRFRNNDVHGLQSVATNAAIRDNVARSNTRLGISALDRPGVQGKNVATSNNQGRARQCSPQRLC